MTIISLLVLLVALTIVVLGSMRLVSVNDRAGVRTRVLAPPGERELPPSDNEVGGRPL